VILLKRVLITGANSYVGTNVENWLMREPDEYYVETLDMKDPNWKNFDFSKFDVVFHVAGIAHVSTKKSMKDLYFKINRDLTIETALKAKESGVKQFIFMSSMIVYNSKETRITLETVPNPDNFYGLSKLQAEEGIFPLQSKNFNITVLRPPVIYGVRSKGNFNSLIKFAITTPFFPKYYNKKSVLYINNLCRYVEFYIEHNRKGVFFPQNLDTVSLYDIILSTRRAHAKHTLSTRLFNQMISFISKISPKAKKIFGDRYYTTDTQNEDLPDYLECFDESILDMFSRDNQDRKIL